MGWRLTNGGLVKVRLEQCLSGTAGEENQHRQQAAGKHAGRKSQQVCAVGLSTACQGRDREHSSPGAAFEVTVSSFILRAAGLKERRKPPGEASFARFQICLTTPSLKNPRQFVNGIFARSWNQSVALPPGGGGSSLWWPLLCRSHLQ